MKAWPRDHVLGSLIIMVPRYTEDCGSALSISRGPALIYYYITEHLTLSETISPASANYEAPTWNVESSWFCNNWPS